MQLMIVFLLSCSALICLKNAPNIPAKNFHALTRLDENRAKCQVEIGYGHYTLIISSFDFYNTKLKQTYPTGVIFAVGP